jgi:hypothetical protein
VKKTGLVACQINLKLITIKDHVKNHLAVVVSYPPQQRRQLETSDCTIYTKSFYCNLALGFQSFYGPDEISGTGERFYNSRFTSLQIKDEGMSIQQWKDAAQETQAERGLLSSHLLWVFIVSSIKFILSWYNKISNCVQVSTAPVHASSLYHWG